MMMAMEAWLAELEMEVDPATSSINNNLYHKYQHCDETIMEGASFTEQLSATLGDDFPYPYSAESNSNSPDLWDLDNIIIDQSSPSPQISNHNDNDNDKKNTNDGDNNVQEKQNMKEEMNKKQTANRGGAKRKRQPSQVQEHILAERKRREVLSQMFISLSALVPGLKKIDKTSVLGEAIKHMKQLQEKVKTLEEEVAKKTVQSLLVVKKSHLAVNDDNNNNNSDDDNVSSSTVDDNNNACVNRSGGGNGGDGDREMDNATDPLPEIEVRISGNTLLLKVYCQNKKGILTKLFQELEKHELSVTNTSVIPFESLALDITVVAQMQIGFNMNANNFVRDIRSAFRSLTR